MPLSWATIPTGAPYAGRRVSYRGSMLARDIAEDIETVQVGDDALEVAQTLGDRRWPGIVVLEGTRPVAVLSAVAVVQALLPDYVRSDPTLAGVLDEASATNTLHRLRGRRVADLLPPESERGRLAAVKGDATAMECAATMAQLNSPLVVVADGDHRHGVVTASHLLELLLHTG